MMSENTSSVPSSVPESVPTRPDVPSKSKEAVVLGEPWSNLAPIVLGRLQAAEKAVLPIASKGNDQELILPPESIAPDMSNLDALLEDVPEDLQEEYTIWCNTCAGLKKLGRSTEGAVPQEFLDSLNPPQEVDIAVWNKLLPWFKQDGQFLTAAPDDDESRSILGGLLTLYNILGGEALSRMLPVPVAYDDVAKRYLPALDGDKFQEFINSNGLKFFGSVSVRLKGKKGGGKKAVFFN